MIPAALAFLRSPIGRYAAIALAVILVLWGIHHAGYRAGVDHQRAEYQKAIEKAEKQALEMGKKSDAITTKANADLTAANAKIAALTTQLNKEIPRYVSSQADRNCRIPAGYVLLRNSAGSGSAAVPESPGRSYDADSGLVLSDLAENDIKNAAAFNTAIVEIKAWRAWYAQQAELWTKEYGAKP